MRISLKNLSIRRKLFFVIGFTTSIALALAFFAFLANHTLIFLEKQRSKLVVLSQVLASNTEAAVAFQDKETAEELLDALKAEPNIVSAAIYLPGTGLFASYGEPSPERPPLPAGAKGPISYEKGHFHILQPVILNEKPIGLVYVRSNLNELFEILTTYVLGGILIILICAIIAFYIAARLQKEISGPVVELSSLAREVSTRKDYSLRASKTAEDEIGRLVDSFNQMLSEIQKRDEALTRSNRDLEQFAYVASHDLQEPLRMVSSYTDLLSTALEGKLEGETDIYMKFLKEGAVRASTLIRDLLDYSRARTQPEFRTVSMETVLREALLNLKLSIDESRASVTHDPLPEVLGDQVKLTLLMQNLIANAVKFRHPGTAPHIHVSARRNGGSRWIIGVEDNGIGIDPQYAERIFVIFQRLHHRDTYEGTGIGLAICKTIVETHGGKIWYEPNPRGGAIFYFTLLPADADPSELQLETREKI